MRTPLIVGYFFVIAGVAKISAQDVRVVITPRSHTIPASGKVVLEVRCINETNHSMTIPSLDEYEVLSSVQSRTRQNEDEATSQGLILDHPAPDRRIEPHQVIRKQISVKLDAKSGDVVELSCEFPRQKTKLKSNTIVLRRK